MPSIELAGTLTDLWGPLWPTFPEVHHPSSTNGMSQLPPFSITVASVLFPIKNANITCGLSVAVFEPPNANFPPLIIQDLAFEAYNVTIPTGNIATPLGCDPRHLINLDQNGQIRLKDTLKTLRPTPLVDGARLVKACIWVGVDYKNPITGYHSFNSNVFQWPSSVGGSDWLDNPGKEDAPYRPSDLDAAFYATSCDTTVRKPYMWFLQNGDVCLVKDQRDYNCPIHITRLYDQGGSSNDFAKPIKSRENTQSSP